MKKTLGLLAILVLLLSGLGFSDSVSFRLGYFAPRANSDLWQIEFDNMTFTKSDFNALLFGFSYEHFLTREISLVIGLDTYSRIVVGDYRDYVGLSFDEGDFAFPSDYIGDFNIRHQLSVSSTPIEVSLKLTPLGRKSGFIPYLGGGVSMYIWRVKLQGDIVDFTDVYVYDDPDFGPVDVYRISYANTSYANPGRETRFAFGFHGFAGFMIPVASRLALEAEFKYYSGKGDLGSSFPDFQKFDLSGYQISLGLNYWF
jgi:opacity protein-like surface antigen